jgi:hypothetical protein
VLTNSIFSLYRLLTSCFPLDCLLVQLQAAEKTSQALREKTVEERENKKRGTSDAEGDSEGQDEQRISAPGTVRKANSQSGGNGASNEAVDSATQTLMAEEASLAVGEDEAQAALTGTNTGVDADIGVPAVTAEESDV